MSEEIKNELEETEALEESKEIEESEDIENPEDTEAPVRVKKNSLFKRIVAWVFLALIAIMFVIFIFMVITGSKYIIPMLFVLIILPFAAYIMIWLRDVFSK